MKKIFSFLLLLVIIDLLFAPFCRAQNTIGFSKKETATFAKKHSLPYLEVDSLHVVKYQIGESIYEAHTDNDTVRLINVIDQHMRLSKIKQKYDETLYLLDKFKWIEFYGKKEFKYEIIFPENSEIIVTRITLLE